MLPGWWNSFGLKYHREYFDGRWPVCVCVPPLLRLTSCYLQKDGLASQRECLGGILPCKQHLTSECWVLNFQYLPASCPGLIDVISGALIQMTCIWCRSRPRDVVQLAVIPLIARTCLQYRINLTTTENRIFWNANLSLRKKSTVKMCRDVTVPTVLLGCRRKVTQGDTDIVLLIWLRLP